VLGALAFWFIGFETRGLTIDEIDNALRQPGRAAQQARPAASS
jgi:hypothetical protein